jgi:hypothetical protein
VRRRSAVGLLRGVVLAVAMSVSLTLGAAPAMAQNQPDVPVQHIIPRPNSGQKPEDPGDRGGSLQLGLLALVCVTLAGGTFHVIRISRKARGLSMHPWRPEER